MRSEVTQVHGRRMLVLLQAGRLRVSLLCTSQQLVFLGVLLLEPVAQGLVTYQGKHCQTSQGTATHSMLEIYTAAYFLEWWEVGLELSYPHRSQESLREETALQRSLASWSLN